MFHNRIGRIFAENIWLLEILFISVLTSDPEMYYRLSSCRNHCVHNYIAAILAVIATFKLHLSDFDSLNNVLQMILVTLTFYTAAINSFVSLLNWNSLPADPRILYHITVYSFKNTLPNLFFLVPLCKYWIFMLYVGIHMHEKWIYTEILSAAEERSLGVGALFCKGGHFQIKMICCL